MQDAARQMQLQILRVVDSGKQKICQRIFLLGWGIAHRRGEVALRVVVNEKYALVFIRQRRGEIQSSRCFPNAAFLVGNADNSYHSISSISARKGISIFREFSNKSSNKPPKTSGYGIIWVNTL